MKGLYLILAALLAAPATAVAQDEGVRGQWSVTATFGATIPAGGEFHEGGRGTVLGLATTVDAKTYSDIFDPGFAWRAGVGYGVGRAVEIIGDFSWENSSASELSVGNVATLDLRAAFADYTSYGLEGGMRFHLAPGASVAPYISAVAGVRWVEAIPGTFSVPAANVTLADTPFFDDSVVPVFGGDFGILFGSSRVRFGVEAGLRYHTDLTDIEGLRGTGLENLNDAGSRWSVPISGVLRFGF
jgi:hypothetical protein